MRYLVAAAFLCASHGALAQGLEPGEWQFDTTVTSPMFPQPQSSTFRRCVNKEEADKPEKWMEGQNKNQSDCKVTTSRKGSDGYGWEMNCPKSGMRGTGTAKLGPGTMQSEQRMFGEMQGQKFDMNIKTSAKRLGACK
jgi:hypothetical protein